MAFLLSTASAFFKNILHKLATFLLTYIFSHLGFYLILLGIFALFITCIVTLGVFRVFALKKIQSGTRDHLTMGEHQLKGKTPTMGGIVFFIPLICLALFHFHSSSAWFIIIATFTSMLVGVWDDYQKVFYKAGISARAKFFAQALGAVSAATYWYFTDPIIDPSLHLGFFTIPLGVGYIAWATFVIMATSHAVNLTDGLDGLATSHGLLTLQGMIAFAFFVLKVSPAPLWYALYLIIACLAFYAFNAYPASLIMGDIGALGLGAYLACLFLIIRAEYALIILGSFFVIETLSVILQYVWWKHYKKRLFLCAPIHHHFEKRGYHETTIVRWSLFAQFVISASFLFFLLKFKA